MTFNVFEKINAMQRFSASDGRDQPWYYECHLEPLYALRVQDWLIADELSPAEAFLLPLVQFLSKGLLLRGQL